MNPLKELKIQAKAIDPLIRIGKKGLTPAMLEEIGKLVKKKKLLKIKFLKQAFELEGKDVMISKILASTQAQLVDAIGNILVIYKR